MLKRFFYSTKECIQYSLENQHLANVLYSWRLKDYLSAIKESSTEIVEYYWIYIKMQKVYKIHYLLFVLLLLLLFLFATNNLGVRNYHNERNYWN